MYKIIQTYYGFFMLEYKYAGHKFVIFSENHTQNILGKLCKEIYVTQIN